MHSVPSLDYTEEEKVLSLSLSFRVPSSSSSSSGSLVVLLLGGVEGLVVGDVGDKGGEAETEAGEQVPEPGSACIVAVEVVAGVKGEVSFELFCVAANGWPRESAPSGLDAVRGMLFMGRWRPTLPCWRRWGAIAGGKSGVSTFGSREARRRTATYFPPCLALRPRVCTRIRVSLGVGRGLGVACEVRLERSRVAPRYMGGAGTAVGRSKRRTVSLRSHERVAMVLYSLLLVSASQRGVGQSHRRAGGGAARRRGAAHFFSILPASLERL